MSALPEPPTSDPPVALAERPLGRLGFVDEGPRDASAVLLLHGVPGSLRDFRYLAPQLSATLRVVRLDLPGFGASAPREAAIRTLDGRAAAALELADDLGLERFALVGHSMGGGPALLLAAARPERVRLCVLVASLALRPHRGLGLPPWAFRLIGHGLGLPLVGRLLLGPTRAGYQKRRFPGSDGLDAATLGRQMRAIGAADFEAMRRAVGAERPPTCVVYAHDDHMVEPELSADLARALDARVLAFDEGGHNLQKTRAREIAALLRERLAASP